MAQATDETTDAKNPSVEALSNNVTELFDRVLTLSDSKEQALLCYQFYLQNDGNGTKLDHKKHPHIGVLRKWANDSYNNKYQKDQKPQFSLKYSDAKYGIEKGNALLALSEQESKSMENDNDNKDKNDNNHTSTATTNNINLKDETDCIYQVCDFKVKQDTMSLIYDDIPASLNHEKYEIENGLFDDFTKALNKCQEIAFNKITEMNNDWSKDRYDINKKKLYLRAPIIETKKKNDKNGKIISTFVFDIDSYIMELRDSKAIYVLFNKKDEKNEMICDEIERNMFNKMIEFIANEEKSNDKNDKSDKNEKENITTIDKKQIGQICYDCWNANKIWNICKMKNNCQSMVIWVNKAYDKRKNTLLKDQSYFENWKFTRAFCFHLFPKQ